ncbi:hypothetical protein SCHPADRAFT_946215 [Schizopora paradoxa]|uniref:Uncharacterized protein n=1 Tax=Schizopora paradoxa TaxID=27342 RepID=A0A0H2R3D0_9AGAM|nr:hypothetical protein SCHPADRAFT_946215 [Schizopora paradoxa]
MPISEPIGRPESDAGVHWALGVVDYTHSRIEYWDSLKGVGDPNTFHKVIKHYICGAAHSEKQNRKQSRGSGEAARSWSFISREV